MSVSDGISFLRVCNLCTSCFLHHCLWWCSIPFNVLIVYSLHPDSHDESWTSAVIHVNIFCSLHTGPLSCAPIPACGRSPSLHWCTRLSSSWQFPDCDVWSLMWCLLLHIFLAVLLTLHHINLLLLWWHALSLCFQLVQILHAPSRSTNLPLLTTVT